MTNEEVARLRAKYFQKEWPHLSEDQKSFVLFDFCRLDIDSSAIMYSLIRDKKPTACLEVGAYLGGSAIVIMKSLQKNNRPFNFFSAEILPDLRQKASQNVQAYCGITPIMIGDITENLDTVPQLLDFLFVDTNHDRETSEWIVKNLWPRLVRGGTLALHDWAVEEIDGKLMGKGDGGVGGTPETEHLMQLYREGKFPFKKIYWSYKNPAWIGMGAGWEIAFWEKV